MRSSRRSGSRTVPSSLSTRSLVAAFSPHRGRPRRCSAKTRRTPSASGARHRPRVTRRTGSTTTSSTAPRRSTPTTLAPRPRFATGSRFPRAGRRLVELRLAEAARFTPEAFDSVMRLRAQEADEFYAELTPAGASEDEALVLRQALAGMLWSKQFYHYDVQRWLDGDPAGPPPPDVALLGPQPRLVASEQHGRDLDARQVGVPVVRGVGSRLPLRRARARRPRVRQVTADPAVPRVVHAPQRAAPRL